jgi:hypothetical protein
VTILADNQVFSGFRAVQTGIFKRQCMGYGAGAVSIGVTHCQRTLVETVDLGDAPFKVNAVTIAALHRIGTICCPMAGQPCCRVFVGRIKFRRTAVGFAATRQNYEY